MTEAIIECLGATIGYHDSPVLHDLELSISRGEVTTILGGSGSGKSTLLKALVGLLPPLSGSIRLFGHDLYAGRGTDRAVLLRRIGMLFQHGALFGSMTVLENVMLPLRELTALPEPVMIEMAHAKLALVEVSELASRTPAEISGGQRKRVALARASVLDPEVVFCDEPTSGLDPIVADSIDRSLLRFRDTLGITIVAVTHDVTSVRHMADRCVMLGRGGVLADGEVRRLERNADPLVRAFFGRDSPFVRRDERASGQSE
jgi:phospholipid/cholesterol/gamma-HCH transport system ATP-binding protein